MGNRTPIEQIFFNISLGVTNVAKPLAPALGLPSLIQAFMISNPSANANSVFIGDGNVSTSTGIEIKTGSAPIFSIDQVRQLYELQDPAIIAAKIAACDNNIPPIDIPVIVWNPSNIFLIASVAGPTTVGLMFFKNVYV